MTTTTVDAPVPVPARPDALARLRGELVALEKNAREAARRRLAGSRFESLVEKFPAQLEGEVDALLDRVGLMRKPRVAAPAVANVNVVDVDVASAVPDAAADAEAAVAVDAPKTSRKSA